MSDNGERREKFWKQPETKKNIASLILLNIMQVNLNDVWDKVIAAEIRF